MAPKEQFSMNPKQLAAAWNEAKKVKDEAPQGFTPEQGSYLMAVVKAEAGSSQSSGRRQVRWDVIFLEGDYAGKVKPFFDGLDRAESLPFLMRRMNALGYQEPDSPEELDKVLKEITSDRPRFKGRIKNNGDFQNLYVDKLLEEGDGPEVPAQASGNGSKAKTSVTKEKGPEVSDQPNGSDGDELAVGKTVGVRDDEKNDLGLGEVKALDEDAGEVTVKLASGKKVIVMPEQLYLSAQARETTAKKKGSMKIGK